MTKTGEITVLNGHTPLLTQVKPSTMYFTYRDEYGMEQRNDFFI
jgi:F0F1-type ATP synthase epsilon subunit